MWIYDAHHTTTPFKTKELILAYTGEIAHNVGGVTVHFALLIPFNKSSFLPLENEVLNTLTTLYQEFIEVLIDEVSLIGSHFLYYMDDQHKNIKHVQTFFSKTLTSYFAAIYSRHNLYGIQ